MMADAKEQFTASLAEKLKEAGKRNMAITSPGEAGRDEAMGNLAEAFADPVGDYVDGRAVAASSGVISSDGTVDVASKTVDDRAYSDLSVAKTVAPLRAAMIDIEVSGDTLVITKAFGG